MSATALLVSRRACGAQRRAPHPPTPSPPLPYHPAPFAYVRLARASLKVRAEGSQVVARPYRLRRSSIRTVSFVDVYRLYRDNLVDLLRSFPDIARRVHEHSVKSRWREIFSLMVKAKRLFLFELFAMTNDFIRWSVLNPAEFAVMNTRHLRREAGDERAGQFDVAVSDGAKSARAASSTSATASAVRGVAERLNGIEISFAARFDRLEKLLAVGASAK